MPNYLNKILIPLVTFLILLVATLIIRALVLRALQHWAVRTNHHLDDLIVQTIKLPSLFLCLAIGLHLAVEFSGTSLSLRFLCNQNHSSGHRPFGGHRCHPCLGDAVPLLYQEL